MTWASLGVRVLGLVVLLPLVLSRLPAGPANLWFLFVSLGTLLNLADFGFSPTFVRIVAYTRSHGDATDEASSTPATPAIVAAARDNPQGVITTMRHIYRRVVGTGIAIVLVGGTAAVWKPIDVAGGEPSFWVAWGLVIAASALRLKSMQYSAYLQGIEQIALLRRWEGIAGLVTTGIACVVVAAGGDLLALVAVTQLGAAIQALIIRGLAIRQAPDDAWRGPVAADAALMRDIWPAAWRSGVGALLSAGVVQVTGIVYAQLAPPSQSASYLLALRLIDTIRVFSNVPFYTRLPQLAKLYASQDVPTSISVAKTGMLATNWIIVIGVVTVAVAGQPLLGLIASQTPFVAELVWLLLGVALLVERIGAMHLQLYSVSNRIVWHVANGVSGLLMICVMPLAYRMLGLVGFPVSLLVGYAGFYTPYSVALSYRSFSLRLSHIDLTASLIPLTALAAFLIYRLNT